MSTGTIKFFNAAKGFGFIEPDAAGKDIFFHVTKVVCDHEAIVEGVRVDYEIVDGIKGPAAVDVRIEGAPVGRPKCRGYRPPWEVEPVADHPDWLRRTPARG